MLLFGEVLAPIQVLGGALVIAAVILAETGRPERSTTSIPASPIQ
jgi:drug/metabolite transporter (DMT)-like permease